MKVFMIILCIIYCLSPIDFFPGPVDDAIVTVATMAILSLIGKGDNGNNLNGQ